MRPAPPGRWEEPHANLQPRGLVRPASLVPRALGNHLDRDALLLQPGADALLRERAGRPGEEPDDARPRAERALVVPLGRDVHVHHGRAVRAHAVGTRARPALE